MQAFAGASSSTSGADSVSVARFEALLPGRHAVTLEGAFPPRVIAVGPDVIWPVLKVLAGAFAAAVAGLGAGLAAGLYGLLRHGTEPGGVPAGTLAPEREKSLRQLTAVVYGLQAGALVVGLTLFAGVIINYLKRREVEGTWLESHFRWQIRTFWWMLAWSVLGLALLIVLVGIPILLAATVWLVYRLVRGWTALNDGKPMYEVTSPRP